MLFDWCMVHSCRVIAGGELLHPHSAWKMRLKYGWNLNPKGFQLAGVQAQLEGIDMIIQAATGSGKTAIAAGPHLWIEGKQSIMVCPLMTLEDEMVCLLLSIGYFP